MSDPDQEIQSDSESATASAAEPETEEIPYFTPDSTVRDVLHAPRGRELLWQHGYDAGEGFSDTLSQYVSLQQAERLGRLRDLEGILDQLNEA